MTHKGPLVRKKPRARKKDGTWRKKHADAGKKRGKIMDNNRDTQFQGFAKVLIEELREADAFTPTTHLEVALQRIGPIIARRAYDLAFHAIDNSRSNDMEDWETDRIMPYVPDLMIIPGLMTELPKEQEQPKIDSDALAHVEECLDMLHTGIMVGLHPKEAALGQWGLESQMKVVESVKADFKRLEEAIKALRKEQ